MKKIFNFALAAAAVIALSAACTKEIGTENENPGENNQEQVVKPIGKTITITATLLDTKVSFDPAFDSGHKPTGMSHTWQTGDKLLVTDESNTANNGEFTLVSGEGTDTGVFEGTIADAASYSVEVVPAGTPSEGTTQTQAKDGDTSHLKFVASATGVTDLKNFTLSETSSIIGIIAKLPADAAVTINQLVIEKSTDDFATSETLTINLTAQEDVNTDDILEVYANIPAGWGIAAGTKMFLRFGSLNANHKVYTRYQEFASAPTLKAGEFNYIKMNCSNIDKYAGSADQGTATAPYLIADPYQMDAMHQLMQRGEQKYFKLIDNIDMTGIVWFPLNNGYPESGGTKYTGNVYDKALDFNGNGKTISNLSTKKDNITDSDEYASIFGVLMGNVYNLTIDNATIYPRRKCGILAGYVGTGSYGPDHCEVTNITIKNSKLENGGSYCGALAGQSAKNGNVFSNITITDCTVSTTGYAAGLIASISSSATVSDITVQGTDVTSTGSTNTSTLADDGFAGGIAAAVKAAVDFDNCEYKSATITGPKNTNESPSTNSRYVGGLVGYVSNNATTFDDCKVNSVKLALNESGSNNNGRYMGGAFGYIGSSVVVGESIGCSVTDLSANDNIRNYVGGFIGYNDGGTIKNCSAAGSFTSRGGLGGFVAFSKGGTYSDDTAAVTISGVGNLGGFVGITDSTAPEFTRCSASGNITASGSYAGGFAGYSPVGEYNACNAAGDVTSSNTYSGGFVGCIIDGKITKCSASGSVSATANFAGGFAGGTGDPNSSAVGGTVTISKSMASGNAQGNSTVSGFVAYAIDGTLEISDSYSSGNVLGNNRRRGGLVAWVENANTTITNCYASGTIVGTFEIGGLVGLLSTSNLNMSKSAAWNSSITANSRAATNWSSAACVGVTYLTSTLTNNYRNPDMNSLIYWGTNSGCSLNLPNTFQHPDVSSSAPLTDPNGNAVTSSTMRPYQGKCDATKTLSTLASTTLGWSGDVWDFTADLPTLK